MNLRPVIGTFLYELRSNTTTARVLVTLSVVLALWLLGMRFSDAWHKQLVFLFPPGVLWALWLAASLVPSRRDDQVYAWYTQSNAHPALLMLASYFGTSLLAWVVIGVALVAALAGAHDFTVFQVVVWSLLTAFGLLAISLWREAEEPRATRPFHPRAIVTALVLVLAMLWSFWLHIKPDLNLDEIHRIAAYGGNTWFFWYLHPRTVALILAFGWLVCALVAIHRAVELSARRSSRSAPVAFAGFLFWMWLVVAGIFPEGDFGKIAFTAFWPTAFLAIVSVVLQPRTGARPLFTEPAMVSAAFVILAGVIAVCAAPESYSGYDGFNSFWVLAVALYLAAHIVFFVGARACLGSERSVAALWFALMFVVWGAVLPVAGNSNWHYLTVVWLAPPVFHPGNQTAVPVFPALAFGTLQLALALLFAWQTRVRSEPPIASVSLRPTD